jgi:hypothetical protein
MSEETFPVSVLARPGLEFVLIQPSARRKVSLASRAASLIPYIIVGMGWLAAAFAATVVAWFAILFTGQYPSALFTFNARALRFLVRANAYSFLLVDARPSLSGAMDPAYPLQVEVTPLAEYNRLLTLFRFPLLIPLYVVTSLAMLVAFVAWLPSLLMITVFRHQPASLQRILAFALRIDARFISSSFLLTEILWISD